jgi:hypothetical protein
MRHKVVWEISCPFRKSYASPFWRRQGVKSGALSCHIELLCLAGAKEWTRPVPHAPREFSR